MATAIYLLAFSRTTLNVTIVAEATTADASFPGD
jgi:hypothetical protein